VWLDYEARETTINQRNTMNITITNKETGEVAEISRSVTTEHTDWIHFQLGTRSESELQAYLDGLHVSMWYENGEHKGDDVAGMSMWDLDQHDAE
jgi:hypothetical protein